MQAGDVPIPVALCADDYAIAPGVSRAILDLIALERLSATSCLTLSPFWPEHAGWLRPLAAHADIGLHFALTDLRPLGAMPGLAPEGRLPSLPRLLYLAMARKLDAAEIEAELDRQIDMFRIAFGRAPDFVDGHHHVHQLPVVRDVVVRKFGTRLPKSTALRICDEPVIPILRRRTAVLPAVVISAFGRGLRRRSSRIGIRANRRFAGVRSFDERRTYRDLFRRFIMDRPSDLLVMCHPGRSDPELSAVDRVTHQRDDEYAYFSGPEFPQDLAAAGLVLRRFTEICVQETSSADH